MSTSTHLARFKPKQFSTNTNFTRVSSKATLRLPTSSILPLLPPILREPLLSSRYHAPKSDSLIIQADDSRKQADNANACFRRLHSLILEI